VLGNSRGPNNSSKKRPTFGEDANVEQLNKGSWTKQFEKEPAVEKQKRS
jgi:hypothetical protein